MNGSSRNWVRLNVALQILCALVALVAATYLGFEYHTRIDLSRSQKFALSGQTKRVIRELKKPLEITVFFSRTTASPVSALYGDVQHLLDEFVFSGRNHISVKVIDPVRDLTRAREAQARFKFRADENLLILEYDGRTQFLPVSEMADFDLTPMTTGGEPRLMAFKGELALTSAMMNLVSPEQKKTYFLQGHGEPGLGADSPLTIFTEYISRQNVTTSPLDLGALDKIPHDAAAVFLIAPQSDLLPNEIDLLDLYWESNGKLMVLLDPMVETPRLDAFLSAKGIRPRRDRVLRLVGLGLATGILREVTAEFYPQGPITKRLAGLRIFLPGATQSLALDMTLRNQIVLQPLLQPLEEFWGEADFHTRPGEGVRYDEGRDAGQPLFVAASADRGGINDDRVQVETGKLVVAGNSQFALDASLSSQPTGLDFLVSATHWLLGRGQFAGVAPKVPRYYALNLTDSQLGTLSLISLIILPGMAVLMALGLWLRRRT